MKSWPTGRQSKLEDEVGDNLNETSLDALYLGVRQLVVLIYSGGQRQSWGQAVLSMLRRHKCINKNKYVR